MKLIFATNNKNKLKEAKDIFKNSNIEICELAEGFTADETGETFSLNAYIKAYEAAKISGLPALGDDSGLSVDALGGRPGVYSSRYEKTDESRINRLLDELQNTPYEKRTARFVCAAAVVNPDGTVLFSCEGTCEGVIADLPRGNNGFGYDPIFFIPEKKLTMAELDESEKNTLSHRGKAFSKVIEWLLNK